MAFNTIESRVYLGLMITILVLMIIFVAILIGALVPLNNTEKKVDDLVDNANPVLAVLKTIICQYVTNPPPPFCPQTPAAG